MDPEHLLAFGVVMRYQSVSREPKHFVERPDVKAYLRENVPKPWFEVHAEIKAPPLTTSYGWTGTAFDYAMRFYLKKLNPSAKARRWLAEESAALVIASRHETARTKKRVLGIVETAKDCVRSYLKSKRDAKPGSELIRSRGPHATQKCLQSIAADIPKSQSFCSGEKLEEWLTVGQTAH